jgi:hypothetical protein
MTYVRPDVLSVGSNYIWDAMCPCNKLHSKEERVKIHIKHITIDIPIQIKTVKTNSKWFILLYSTLKYVNSAVNSTIKHSKWSKCILTDGKTRRNPIVATSSQCLYYPSSF